MRGVSYLAPDSQTLQLWRQDAEHGSTGDERRGTQGSFKFVRRAIVIPDGLVLATRHLHSVKGGDLWRREVVQGSVDVPSIKAGIPFGRVLRGNLGLVETRVLRVL